MLPYWLLFSVFAAGSLQYRRRGLIGSQSAPLLWAAGLLVALMIGLRYQVGGDWGAYQRLYEEALYLKFGTLIGRSDPGYMILNWAAAALGVEIWFVNLVCGLVFTYGLLAFARREPNPWLAMAVAVPYLIIVVAMGYSRQAVAIGLLMAGLATLNARAMGRFVIYILLAASFHKTAIIVLPLVALSLNRNRLFVLVNSAAAAVLGFYVFLEPAMDQFTRNYVGAQLTSEGAWIRILMNLVPATLFLFLQKRFGMSKEQRILWRNLSLAAVATFFLLLVSTSSTVVDRLALYMIPLQLVVLSRLPYAFQQKGRPNPQLTLAVLAYSALVQFTWLNFAVHADYWMPYHLYPLFGN